MLLTAVAYGKYTTNAVVITNKYCCHSELLKNQSPREVKDGAA
jgi:hypothetical protein